MGIFLSLSLSRSLLFFVGGNVVLSSVPYLLLSFFYLFY